MFGCQDVKAYQEISSTCIQYSPNYPAATGLTAISAFMAPLSGADAYRGFKTPDEAMGLPSLETTAKNMEMRRAVCDVFRGQTFTESNELQMEMDTIEMEAKLILERALELGDDDIVVGTNLARETGELDLPFTSTNLIKNKALIGKDSASFVRFLDCGNLPFSDEVKEFQGARLKLENQTFI